MKKTVATPETPDYRQMLLDRRREVLASLGGKFDTRAKLGRVAEDDQAQLSHDEFVSLRINSLDYAQLRMVDEALDRLQAGDYGICLACEEPIAPKRLRAIPWARYCVTCQETIGRELDREMATSA
jgi:DnaK suppressor protein